jgi:hypothetical protein
VEVFDGFVNKADEPLAVRERGGRREEVGERGGVIEKTNIF